MPFFNPGQNTEYAYVLSVILSWFVDADVVDSVMRDSSTMTVGQVKRRVNTAAVLDDSVCLHAVRKYCDSASWAALEAVVADVKRDHVWL